MSVIRRYQPTDRSDVYRVCVMTGTGGGDATGLHANDNVIPDIFAEPYRAIEPDLAFVVDTGERRAGYVIAIGSTRLFARHYREALRGSTPILARSDAQGAVIVRAGQRRTLAARRANFGECSARSAQANPSEITANTFS